MKKAIEIAFWAALAVILLGGVVRYSSESDALWTTISLLGFLFASWLVRERWSRA